MAPSRPNNHVQVVNCLSCYGNGWGVLQSRMAAGKQLNSDHSTTSLGSNSKRTPRMSASNRQGSTTANSSGSNQSNSGNGGAMTAEEKHIQRMRLVMNKREAASGLPQRCAHALSHGFPVSHQTTISAGLICTPFLHSCAESHTPCAEIRQLAHNCALAPCLCIAKQNSSHVTT